MSAIGSGDEARPRWLHAAGADAVRSVPLVRRVKKGTPSVHPIGGAGDARCAGCYVSNQSRGMSPHHAARADDHGGLSEDVGADRGDGRVSVSAAPAHTPARVRVQACQRRTRHPRGAALSRAQECSAHTTPSCHPVALNRSGKIERNRRERGAERTRSIRSH
jgi:hypothetical protein